MDARAGWRRLQSNVFGWQRTTPRRGAARAAGGGPTTQWGESAGGGPCGGRGLWQVGATVIRGPRGRGGGDYKAPSLAGSAHPRGEELQQQRAGAPPQWGGSAGGGPAGAGDCGRWGPQLTDDRARRWWRLHGASCGLARTTSTQAAAHAAGRGPTTVGRVRRQGPAGAGDQGRRGPWSLSDCTPPCRAPQPRQPRRISTGGKERCSEGPKNNAKRSRTRWRTPVRGAPSRLACGKGGEGTAEHHPQRPGTRIALVVRSGRGSGRDRDWRSWPGARRSGGSLR